MLQKLISHSPDLRRFWDEGYEVEVRDNHLLLHHVPYLNSSSEIKYGTLVSTLNLAGDVTLKPDTHVAYFIGETPCDKAGCVISAILNSSSPEQLTPNIRVHHTFSSKPTNGYADYFEKMTTYLGIISSPAKSLHDSVTEKTFVVVAPEDSESVFNYLDTNSSRAKIDSVSRKLADQRVAIVGLGGTGSYILDLVAKTLAREIHLYDGDVFKTHNAFRAPGAPSLEKLRERIKKTDYLKTLYERMHRNIFSHGYYLTAPNIDELSVMDFVFLSFDKGDVKKQIVEFLQQRDIPFIDTGMGLHKVDDQLVGILRVTASTHERRDHVTNRIPFDEGVDDEYATNIQIADLNALNATLAVIKWKKLYGFYNDLEKENHTMYSINVNMLTSSDNDP
jgi:hypothetical protein